MAKTTTTETERRTRYATELPNGPVRVSFPGVAVHELEVEDGTVLLDAEQHRALTLAGHRFGTPNTPPTGSGETPDTSGTTE